MSREIMFTEKKTMTGKTSELEASGVEDLLASLSEGRLAQRIAEASRLALARHMVLTAQEMRSSVGMEFPAK